MLHHPSKYHPNPLSHFLALTSTSSTNPMGTGKIELETHVNQTPLDDLNGSAGKSFTIAAILGLKKNVSAAAAAAAAAAVQMDHHLNSNEKDFAVMNLSLNNHNLVKNNLNLNESYATESRLLGVNGNGRLPMNLAQHFNSSIHHNPHHNHHGSTPSALQSLQQLHQHHNSQNSTAFQGRERSKNEQLANKKSSLKSKRVRTIFTPEQLERLESEFERQQYMVGPERLYLAHTLQLTEAQVKVWFQNRRIKWRKHHLELTQQRLALIRQRQIPGNGIQTTPLDSELTICTDSMDANSVQDGEL